MSSDLRKWRILLVEDNPGDVRLTQEALEELKINHCLQIAADGVLALECLDRAGQDSNPALPDLILLDINLPRLNGLEVLAVIKSSDRTRSIPVIIMSSSAADTDVAEAYRLNANCYAKKPIEIDGYFEVMDSIRRFWMETALLPRQHPGSLH